MAYDNTHIIMNRIIFLFCTTFTMAVAAMAQTETPDSITRQHHIDDFNFALHELETSYAGFETCVTDANRQQYDSIVSSLRVQIETQNRPGYDAALYLYSWFDDGHLGIDLGSYRETGKYMSDRQKFHPYEMIKPYSPEPTAKPVTSKTFLMRLPDFDEETVSVEWIENAIRNFNTSTCENLIIDVRYNGGGDERIWHPLLPLIYDHPGTTKSVEFRMSYNNIEFLRQAAPVFPEAQMILDKYNRSHEPYILLTDKEDIEIEVPPYAGKKPLKVAFIIDANNGSATEELLIQAKAISNRTSIYGKENTSGCLDYSSVRETTALPHSKYPIFIPTARSCRLPDNGIDKTGIAPDFTIPIDYPQSLTDNLDEWTIWVAGELEK